MAHRIERLADLVLIITCAVALGFLGYRILHRGGPATYAVGDHLEDTLQRVLPASQEALILIKLSSQCEYCSLSMIAFRELAQARRTGALAARIVVAGQEDPAGLAAFMADNQFIADRVVDIRSVNARLTGLPFPHTILLSANGAVLESWPGLFTQTRARQLVALSRGIAAR